MVSVSWNETFILGALGLGVIAAVLAGGDVLAQELRAKKPPSDVVHRLEHNGLSLEMAPLSFEQVSAFLVGRGLSKDDAELAARRGCIFRSALGNTATTPNGPHVVIKLEEWRILRPDKVPAKLGLREDWDMFWRARSLAEAPSVAFHWALFPSEQIFAPTDHNWGFLSFMLAPGMAFSLEVKWRTGGSPHSARFDGLRCAS